MAGTPSPDPISTRQQRIATLARQSPQTALHVAGPPHRHRLADRGVPAHAQGRGRGRGRTDGGGLRGGPGGKPPVAAGPRQVRHATERRPCDGCISRRGPATETRPIGIPTFEDKVLQRAVVMVLEAVYEQDFLDCSYGFRPGRSAHQALDALWQPADGGAGRVGPGDRHPEVFRHAGPPPPAGDPSPQGT